jgi:hypothetical protein
MSIKKIIMTIIPYVALPVGLLLLAGLIGFGIVVALDVWAGFYFVDGIPIATAFLVAASIAGLAFLQPAGAPATLARFKTVFSSPVARLQRLGSRAPKNPNPGSPFEQQRPEVVTNNADFNAVGGGPSPSPAGRRRVHSVVVWGKPTRHSNNFNCSIIGEANKKYDKRG